MKPADLVFVAGLGGLFAATARALWLVRCRRGRAVRRLMARTGAAVAAYVAIVAVVSLSTPQQWIAVGEEQRFDDWSLTVTSVSRVDRGYRLGVRVANHGRGRPQRATDANVLLVAVDGRSFAPIEGGHQSLRRVLQPGEAHDTELQYGDLGDTPLRGADVIHGAWPQWFIIGDRGSLFHKRPLVRLPPD